MCSDLHVCSKQIILQLVRQIIRVVPVTCRKGSIKPTLLDMLALYLSLVLRIDLDFHFCYGKARPTWTYNI